ncbi:MAG TPA: tetratricopeptide repeat protein [Candidatus Polarisedimenticolia bacterium]|jgi:tetratricopeptide (TPR) repeat protein
MQPNGAAESWRRIATCFLAAATLLCPSPLIVAQDPSTRLEAARAAIASSRLDKALREIQKVLESDPANVEAWKLKGEVALRQADLDGALTCLTEASRLQPDNPELLVSIGDLLARRNDRLDEALAVFERALKLDPGSPRILISKGSIHERREQWDEAAEAFRAALLLDPNLVRARSSLGAVFFKIGRYEDASRELRKAIELSPHDLRSHVFLGLAQNHLGNFGTAVEELKEALLIDPHSANQLIGVREQQAQFLRLIDLFVKAYEESPREAGRSYDLAVVYFFAGDYDSAWKLLIRAEQLRYPIPIELKEVVWSKRRLRAP